MERALFLEIFISHGLQQSALIVASWLFLTYLKYDKLAAAKRPSIARTHYRR